MTAFMFTCFFFYFLSCNFFTFNWTKMLLTNCYLFLCPCHPGPPIKPYYMDPVIPFPPARPTIGNILAICHYSNYRPRYTADMLPKNVYGYLQRRANAINQLESWFSVCCSNGTQDEEMAVCCAQQAVRKQADCLHIVSYNSHYYRFSYLIP